MKQIIAKKSNDIAFKAKQSLLKQSVFIQDNAQLYLEFNSIALNGNGKIITSHSNFKGKPKKINFSSSDSIAASIESTKKTGILISCSHRRAGGGWLSGSFAQEESISRSTTWAVQAGLKDFKYWYKENSWYGQNGALVIDGLLIFNENNKELINPKKVVFAGVAAANKAALNNDTYWNNKNGINERENYFKNNLICALEELEIRGVEDVTLCAFGTNVFGWKLEESIKVLHESTKYASDKLNFNCAVGSEQNRTLAEEIYIKIIEDENSISML